MAPDTHPVRVVIREVTYAHLGKNILDQPQVMYSTAYGPGRPEIEPTVVLGPDFDPESQAAQDAFLDFKLGQKIDLLDEDYIRLKNGGAVKDAAAAEAQAVEAEEEVMDVRTASVDDLARWIETERPTVQEVVDATGGEPDLARKLLEAESQATDQDPRKGVLDGLSAVIARG
jgi:hypothetical protein